MKLTKGEVAIVGNALETIEELELVPQMGDPEAYVLLTMKVKKATRGADGDAG